MASRAGATTAATTTAGAATASAAFDPQRAGRPGPGRPAQHLAELFEAHAAMVLGICRGMLRHAHDAEDAAQQTFLSAYASLAGGTVPREPAAWLATIARNECRTRAHRRMREPVPGEELEVDAGGDPAEQAVRSEEVESLRHALARLPGQQRHAFLLREFSGLSYDELAEELGVTRPAVESLLFRARQQLRVSLRTALAAVTSAPMGLRDWLAQLFGSSPETPAAAAKLGALAVVAKIAAAGAGTALVAAGVVAVAPHHHREAARPHGAVVRHAAPPATHVVRRPAPAPVHHVAASAPAPPRPQPVTTTPAPPVTGRHDGRPETRASGDHASSGPDGGDVRTQTGPEHQDSSSGGGPGPSGEHTTTTTTVPTTTTTSSSGDGSHGSDGGTGSGGGSGSGDGGSGGGHDSGGGD